MSKVRTHYDNLQVKETASNEVIKGAYRYLSQKWHPDKNQHNREEAERILRIINQAYATLSDPTKRKEHDEWIESQRVNPEDSSQNHPQYTEQKKKDKYTGIPITVVRPWVRLWARTIDIFLLFIFTVVTLTFLPPSAPAENMNYYANAIIILMVWAFVEPFFLSTIGTTPGKWLLNTKIKHKSGRIPLGDASTRSFSVWCYGMSIGFPIVMFVTLYIAYNKLNTNGQTTWDSDNGFTVTHERIGVVRVIVAGLIVSIFMLFVVAGSA